MYVPEAAVRRLSKVMTRCCGYDLIKGSCRRRWWGKVRLCCFKDTRCVLPPPAASHSYPLLASFPSLVPWLSSSLGAFIDCDLTVFTSNQHWVIDLFVVRKGMARRCGGEMMAYLFFLSFLYDCFFLIIIFCLSLLPTISPSSKHSMKWIKFEKKKRQKKLLSYL